MRFRNLPSDGRRVLLAATLLLVPLTTWAQTPVALRVSPLRLSFIGAEGTETLAPQRLEIGGGGTFAWRARATAPWIAVSPDHGEGPAALLVSIASRPLSAGSHQGSVIIDSPGASGSPVVVTVQVIIARVRPKPDASAPTAATLTLTPAQVAFSAPAGHLDKLPFSVRVAAGRDARVKWTAGVDQKWLAVTPGEGTTPAEIRLVASPAGLSAGTYHATLVVRATRQDPAVRVPVTLALQPSAGEPLAFAAATLPTAGMNLPYSVPIPVRGGRPPYVLQLVQGQLPPELALVSGTITGIPRTPGTSSFSVMATDSGSPPETVLQTFMLTISVIDQYTGLIVRPAQVILAATLSRPPATVTMTIESGGPPLTWRASTDTPWLKIQPTTGVAPASLTITADMQGVTAGIFAGSIEIAMEGAPNSPVRVPVKLTVK